MAVATPSVPARSYAGSLARGRRVVASALTAVFASLLFAAVAAAQNPSVQLTTNRGCIESGQNPVFMVGDNITVAFRIGSSTDAKANATLFDLLPNGFVNVFGLGNLSTNVTFAFVAKIAPPTGTETLILRATLAGGASTQRACSTRAPNWANSAASS